jgi:hypothetical protein
MTREIFVELTLLLLSLRTTNHLAPIIFVMETQAGHISLQICTSRSQNYVQGSTPTKVSYSAMVRNEITVSTHLGSPRTLQMKFPRRTPTNNNRFRFRFTLIKMALSQVPSGIDCQHN